MSPSTTNTSDRIYRVYPVPYFYHSFDVNSALGWQVAVVFPRNDKVASDKIARSLVAVRTSDLLSSLSSDFGTGITSASYFAAQVSAHSKRTQQLRYPPAFNLDVCPKASGFGSSCRPKITTLGREVVSLGRTTRSSQPQTTLSHDIRKPSLQADHSPRITAVRRRLTMFPHKNTQ